ncbi:keratin-associated protein 10-6-like [Panicum virgatum]|uniref:keratin-associated protein 10-6-like n=1 Tax=Panicum virgatum TaxID=38727 RepID=UPI0019D571BD|nr:keratin-associated protein 10-6-like [Panicum virgatum]
MASSCGVAALLKGAMVVAVWVVLLHSSTGQQQPVPAPEPAPASPPPPPDCSNCSSICTPSCEEIVAGNTASFCRETVVPNAYRGCLEYCANTTCSGGNTHGACCSIGTCTPQHCGNDPCVQDCCKSCTATANAAYDDCKLGNMGGSNMHGCMDGCMSSCKEFCITH